MVYFEDDHFLVKPPVAFLFGRSVRVKYEDIERIEFVDGGDVFFYLSNGKCKKVSDPVIVMFYAEFGDMIRKYRIPYKMKADDVGDATIETVRERAAVCKESASAYLNRSVKEKLGTEYEFEVRIAERIIGTVLEFRLLKNGVLAEELNENEGLDGDPIVDEMDIAFLYEWEPVSETGTYLLLEEAKDSAACEKFLEEDILGFFYAGFKNGEDGDV